MIFSPDRSVQVTILSDHELKRDGGENTLPNLKPGDAAWTSDAKVKPATIVKLFTPTGFDMAYFE